MKNVLTVLIFINKTRACLSDALFLRSQPVHPEKIFSQNLQIYQKGSAHEFTAVHQQSY